MNEQTKFTPGPWCVCRIHDKPGIDSTVIGLRIQQVHGEFLPVVCMNGVTARDHANAQLLATSTEMYAALELALPILEQYSRIGYGNAEDAAEATRKALTKAREGWWS